MIDSSAITGMVEHWLDTPVNGYVGSSYGADIASLLFAPLSDNRADAFLAKMKQDIPVLAMLNDEQLTIQAETQGFEVVMLYLRIGSIMIPLGKPDANTTGETVRGNSF